MGNRKGILSSDWLSERARWARRRPKAVKKKLNINDSRGFTVLQTQLGFWSQIFLPCYKSVTDKACSVKIAGYLPRFFLYAFIGLDFHSFHKNRRKKGTWLIYSHLDLTLSYLTHVFFFFFMDFSATNLWDVSWKSFNGCWCRETAPFV